VVFIPPGTEHAIHNPGPGQVYLSATSLPFDMPNDEFAYQLPARPDAE
jgi:mannose-6-phosphate isomerase-like protein (cupin superfamily)